MEQRVLVLNFNEYHIVDEKTGQVTNEGISVNYLFPYSERRDSVTNEVLGAGMKVGKSSFPLTSKAKFNHIPAYYNLIMETTLVSGKPSIKVTDIVFLDKAKIEI